MTAVQYLEAAKIEALAEKLRAEGYEVVLLSGNGHGKYDLTATKGSRRIAIEVKAKSHLAESVEEIRRLREQARAEGYDEFRLVVVSPPHEVEVDVEGLTDTLATHLTHDTPGEIVALPGIPSIEDVSDVTPNRVSITADGIRLQGDGMVEVALTSSDHDPREDSAWHESFPFEFDVELNHDLEIVRVHHLEVDTTGLFE